MKIVVVGGTGLIGTRRWCKTFVKWGHEVEAGAFMWDGASTPLTGERTARERWAALRWSSTSRIRLLYRGHGSVRKFFQTSGCNPFAVDAMAVPVRSPRGVVGCGDGSPFRPADIFFLKMAQENLIKSSLIP